MTGHDPKLLIMDSNVTTQPELAKLTERGITLITLRARTPKLTATLHGLPASDWAAMTIARAGGKTRRVRVIENTTATLSKYPGTLSQIAVAGAVPLNVPLNVDLNVVLTVLAHTICATMRRGLPGYATTTPDILQRRYLQTSGEILNQGNDIIVRLDRRAYSPVLRQAELPTVTVPWWGNRRLSYQFAQN